MKNLFQQEQQASFLSMEELYTGRESSFPAHKITSTSEIALLYLYLHLHYMSALKNVQNESFRFWGHGFHIQNSFFRKIHSL